MSRFLWGIRCMRRTARGRRPGGFRLGAAEIADELRPLIPDYRPSDEVLLGLLSTAARCASKRRVCGWSSSRR